MENLRDFLCSAVALDWFAKGALCRATIHPEEDSERFPAAIASRVPSGAVLVEHEPIRFPNYPYEWAPEMLRAAADATLRLAGEALKDGFRLKDATPYNLMFDGPSPVFIDLLSFESHDSLDAIWPAYAQFVRTFVYPLYAVVYCGSEISELLMVHRDGIKPARMARLLGARRWLPRFAASVALPALLSRDWDGQAVRQALNHKSKDAGEALFLLAARFAKAARLLPDVPSSGRESSYMKEECGYSPAEWGAKEKAVATALNRYQPRRVLDVGCNAGHFSRMAEKSGADVVAVDRDPMVTGAVWRAAAAAGSRILPLVVDIARPTAACGWENSECPSFLERARGQFDGVLMLALIHHLMVDERVPLDRTFDLAAQLTERILIVEYVDPSDRQFRAIARGRDALYRNFSRSVFENQARERFEIADVCAVTATRVIYVLERRR